ncbi:MAG: type II secretion system protein [Candidatus Omnitrophota bacterium]|jgi:prepilin-type N-terminal cleavage/methylation domain-containing protein|nr:type II secretion system protein [Candidatus Omnitrophota bacterium]MDD5665413.1 type II secretion system protein [Candidatus Omnitrophota bacterium]
MPSGKSGFTLSELLLAVAILAFAMSGMLYLFVNCSFLDNANRNLSLAVSHGQFVMEDIKDADFSGLQASINAGVWNWDAVAISAKGLTALDNESIITASTGVDPLHIVVTVLWKDRGSIDRSFILETLIASP